MIYIYVLKLNKGKYYVGKTTNPKFRLNSHFNSKGSEWTKKYNPLKMIELISNCDHFDEDKITMKYMNKYGINNVRGGSFVSLKLDKSTIGAIKQMLNGANDKCFHCGNSGHFANNCKEKYNYEEKDEETDVETDEETDEEMDEELEEGLYDVDGNTLCWYEDEWYEESQNHIGHRDGTIDIPIARNYSEGWRPIKNEKKYKNNNSCYRCGRKGHYSSECYASKHIKGYYI